MEQRSTYLLTHSFITYLFGAKEGPSSVLKMSLDKKGEESWKHRCSPSTEDVNHQVTPGQWGHSGRGTPRSEGGHGERDAQVWGHMGRGTSRYGDTQQEGPPGLGGTQGKALSGLCVSRCFYICMWVETVCKLMSVCVCVRERDFNHHLYPKYIDLHIPFPYHSF